MRRETKEAWRWAKRCHLCRCLEAFVAGVEIEDERVREREAGIIRGDFLISRNVKKRKKNRKIIWGAGRIEER
jgi:hypothetical protein